VDSLIIASPIWSQAACIHFNFEKFPTAMRSASLINHLLLPQYDEGDWTTK
jgi:hypothetical protein